MKMYTTLLCTVFFLAGVHSYGARQDFDTVEIQTEKITENIYMLTGKGGNIGLSAGEDCVFMIDDQYAPLTDKITAAIKIISDKPVEFVVNTHWHQDHTGGNENMGEQGAVIVAHENVRKRLGTDQFIAFFGREVPASPEGALPVITFTRDLTFHLNGDRIDVFHLNPGHTDGDAVIFFRESNVAHLGDTYFEGKYPFIDLSAGGSINGMITAVEKILPMLGDDTKIIPGHGPLSNKEKLQDYHDMLLSIRDQVKNLIEGGKTLEEAIASKPTQDFDERLGNGFITPDKFVEIVYKSLKPDKKEKLTTEITEEQLQ